ncbi:MAG: serine/threonine-protein phosphatase [Chloroflexota bacterium]|nr:serine/threonine-protein phosphatase [Chloroflexota bacterium]
MPRLLVGVGKMNRYASRDSGDTVEVVERPGGGFSVVVADAQGSGTGAKLLSSLVTARAVSLLKDGVRDTAVHEAVHDHLYHYKGGKVSCTLTTLTADTRRRILTITRNTNIAGYFVCDGSLEAVDDQSSPLGNGDLIRPVQRSVLLKENIWAVVVTDGIARAGTRTGEVVDIGTAVRAYVEDATDAQCVAERLLSDAVQRDRGRPVDDMSVAVLGVLAQEPSDERRFMAVSVPLREDMLWEKEY